MIEIKNKQDCCGCAACEQVCPVNAIKMKPDEQGFLYPEVSSELCVHCGKCLRTCPIINPTSEIKTEQQAALVQHKDKIILKESASGGAFSGIAQIVLDMGGVVFGAAYDKDFSVRHTYVEKKEDLSIFRNSKYVQSKTENSYREVLDFIKQERFVLYSGTPCQIEGLLNYLGKPSQYLFTADIVCHAVPSPLVWKTYLELLKEKSPSPLTMIRFRDKTKYGYLYSQFSVTREKQKTVYEGIETNQMLRAFFSEICNRPSCYECRFKKRYRRSDITMWDCFDLSEFTDSNVFLQKDGVSRVMVHSEKGKMLLERLAGLCTVEEITPEKALSYDAVEMVDSVEKDERYDEFWKMFYKAPKETLLKFFPNTSKTRLERIVRIFAFKTGLYSVVRGFYKKTFGNRKR